LLYVLILPYMYILIPLYMCPHSLILLCVGVRWAIAGALSEDSGLASLLARFSIYLLY
jgi:hypothetical protein